MKQWLSGSRGTVLMTLLWTVGWGLGFGGLIELLVDPSGIYGDVWPTALAIPGFIGGAVFSTLLRVAEGRRRFDEVPPARFVTWGAVTGLVLGILSAATGMPSVLPLATAVVADDLRLAAPVAIGITTALGAVAAIGSAVFFRLVVPKQIPA